MPMMMQARNLLAQRQSQPRPQCLRLLEEMTMTTRQPHLPLLQHRRQHRQQRQQQHHRLLEETTMTTTKLLLPLHLPLLQGYTRECTFCRNHMP
jgi:hypothetical protein